MTTNHDRCPAGHTFIGPDSWLRQTWLAAHGDHEATHVNDETDGEGA